MSNNYSVLASPQLTSQIVGIYGQVNTTYVLIAVYKSALDQAFAASGQAGIQGYLGPLMLATSTSFYASAGDQNPTVHSSSAMNGLPSGSNYSNMPSSWTA